MQLLDVPYVPQSGASVRGARPRHGPALLGGEPGVLAEDFAALRGAGPARHTNRDPRERRRRRAAGCLWCCRARRPASRTNWPGAAPSSPCCGSAATPSTTWWSWPGPTVGCSSMTRTWGRCGPCAKRSSRPPGPGAVAGHSWSCLRRIDAEGAHDPVDAAVSRDRPPSPHACSALMEAGVLLARHGRHRGAERQFLAAQSLCPASALPLRERAGLTVFAPATGPARAGWRSAPWPSTRATPITWRLAGRQPLPGRGRGGCARTPGTTCPNRGPT